MYSSSSAYMLYGVAEWLSEIVMRMPGHSYFAENVSKRKEVYTKQEYDDEVLSLMSELSVIKAHKY